VRWEDESYVRWYRRNTPEWSLLSWQARGLFGLIMREVDRAGILELGRVGLKAVAVSVRAPWEEIERPLADLIEDGCIIYREDLRLLLIPNFVAAQEASASDRARQRASRERARDLARARDLVSVEMSQNGAPRSRGVTGGHKNGDFCHSDLIRSDPNKAQPSDPAGGDVTLDEVQRPEPPKPAKTETAFDLAQRLYAEAYRKRHREDFMLTSFGHKGSDEYAFVNLARLAEAKGDVELWLRHWIRSYLKDDERWLVDNRHPPRRLLDRLNKYGAPKKPKPPASPPSEPPPVVTRPFVPLKPIVERPQLRAASTPAELADKARADKQRLAEAERLAAAKGAK
jgi:hypothetical protein